MYIPSAHRAAPPAPSRWTVVHSLFLALWQLILAKHDKLSRRADGSKNLNVTIIVIVCIGSVAFIAGIFAFLYRYRYSVRTRSRRRHHSGSHSRRVSGASKMSSEAGPSKPPAEEKSEQ